ncbi:MAG: ATP-binding protein [Bacteroidota bacterium]|nr:ATP-binding protein [Bacteroidota bacterium]MXW33836.1 ATP-binding protein [Rhodothermaceae bacterium]MDE2645578.1 ATP-binding protein [Bacteroidota bacterium]MYC05002.1 ATP-binding protein [Rhodothermaceae bacterium]MYE64129.1 ATP-binding protein [Rhodothermaceae bacterium]
MPQSRPSPTAPLTVTFERGPAPYFHGRKQILGNFKRYMDRAEQIKSGGTIFLIQGAPGAGKTALLYECEKHARARRWEVASIHPDALWDTAGLMHSLGRGHEFGISEKTGTIDVKVAKGEYKSVPVPSTTLDILNEGRLPLLLIMDEAQTLGTTNKPTSEQQANIATNVLRDVHNGNLGRPIILLAAGLGLTVEVFESLGISRFDGSSLVELGGLSKEAECAVIQDWINKDGGATGDPTAWIDAIANKTHGWPQHIVSYADAAAKQVVRDHGEMTPEGLDAVFKVGDAAREVFYQHRAKGLLKEHRVCLANSVKHVKVGTPVDHIRIRAALTEEFEESEAERLFKHAQRKGILDERDGEYYIPIPSMHDWLVCNYSHKK